MLEHKPAPKRKKLKKRDRKSVLESEENQVTILLRSATSLVTDLADDLDLASADMGQMRLLHEMAAAPSSCRDRCELEFTSVERDCHFELLSRLPSLSWITIAPYVVLALP